MKKAVHRISRTRPALVLAAVLVIVTARAPATTHSFVDSGEPSVLTTPSTDQTASDPIETAQTHAEARVLRETPSVTSLPVPVPSPMRGVLEAGVLPGMRHFPGHGSVPTDSHIGLPVQIASLEQLREHDWKPFKKGWDPAFP